LAVFLLNLATLPSKHCEIGIKMIRIRVDMEN
jgi:hypothetical protein